MNFQYLTLKNCSKGCCDIKLKPYIPTHKTYDYKNKIKKNKAGIFFYDPILNKVLLVQSRGEKWGPPKGTMEDNESVEQCAIREVKEETGIDIGLMEIQHAMKFKIDRATYYYLEKDSSQFENVSSLTNILDNDASGISWINTDCLVELNQYNRIDLNSHCKKLLQKILKIKFL